MKTNTQPINAFTIVLFLLFFNGSFSQGALKEIPLNQQIEESSLVVEGKVIDQRSFWNLETGLIHTANTVEVYKVFKGVPIETLEVVTVGGTVGFNALIASNALKLRQGDIGLFTLTKSKLVDPESSLVDAHFDPYGAVQGFYKYNLVYDLAVNVFNKISGIGTSFYEEVMEYTKLNYIEISRFDIKRKLAVAKGSNSFPPSSLTLDKSSASAGTKDSLTIDGSGFGVTKGKVFFSDADFGGSQFISALDTQVTWSDTQIIVEVPSRAGTGPIFVQDAGAAQSPLSSTLTITYAEINVQFNPGGGFEDYQVQHYDDNVSGGYTWEMYTDFFNDTEHPGARAAFERAFENWRCTTDINWDISGTATTTDVIGIADLVAPFDGELDADDENVIRFDNGSELGVGVLGTCYSWYSSCNGTDWWVSDLDIVFDDTANWYFGTGTPGGAQFDFESVALHELGHGHQLAHVIDDTNDVMHYTLTNGEDQRVLNANNVTAAGNVQTRSTSMAICSRPLMTDYAGVCVPLSISEKELNAMISLYPNPSNGVINIRKTSSINLEKAVIYDLSGRMVFEQNLTGISNTKTVNLRSVSTGLYFAEVRSDLGILTKKIIVE
jgi:hypothetical protein